MFWWFELHICALILVCLCSRLAIRWWLVWVLLDFVRCVGCGCGYVCCGSGRFVFCGLSIDLRYLLVGGLFVIVICCCF